MADPMSEEDANEAQQIEDVLEEYEFPGQVQAAFHYLGFTLELKSLDDDLRFTRRVALRAIRNYMRSIEYDTNQSCPSPTQPD